MKDSLEKRLAELEQEYQSGQKMLAELDERRAALTNTMLRIQGAMQVLRELLGQGEPPAEGGAPRG
jgi:uncharacterized coiled-coil protein SlyX